MQESVTRKGTHIRHSDSDEIRELGEAGKASATRRRDASGANENVDTSALLKGITADPNMELHDSFTLVSTPSTRRGKPTGPTEVEVDIDEDENAALLLERDGVYEWRLHEDSEGEVKVRRRSGKATGKRKLLFRLDDSTVQAPSDGARRRGLIEFVSGKLTDHLRAYIIKFVAQTAVSGAAKFLERNVKPGLIVITDQKPENWRVGDDKPAISFPKDRAARLLLFIHGTFSSTHGGFGALGVTPEGKQFLEDARKYYDAVLAFDHATLSESPEENAIAICQAMKALSVKAGSAIDIICHSRGGLVARTLVERLLGDEGWFLKPEKVVFVGSTNGGTALADRENWKSFLDLYTNLAIAAGRGLAIFDAGAASGMISESVKTLGAFVQAIIDAGVTDGMTPGLSAMSPRGEFIGAINGPLRKPDAFNVEYYAIGSDFDTKLFSPFNATPSLPERLVQALANYGVDNLMKASNDLVVDTASMTQFGPRNSRLNSTLAWDANAVIFHTNYFSQPAVVQALRAWLIDGVGNKHLPIVATNPLVIPADIDTGEAGKRLANLPGDRVVVIERQPYGYYVRTANYIRARIEDATANETLAQTLGLRETQIAQRVDDQSQAPQNIGENGWLRIVNGQVTEAAPPALPVLAERPQRNTGSFSTGGDTSTIRRGPKQENLVSSKPQYAEEYAAAQHREPGLDSVLEGMVELAPNVEEAIEDADIRCHFGAEMPESNPVSELAELTVTVSRDEIEKVLGPTSVKSDALVQPNEPIIIEVKARANCEVVGDASVKLRVPERGKPGYYDFKIRGKTAGPAELWVDARQGARRLSRMVLQPQFVATGKISATAVVDTRDLDPPLVELRIFENADRPDAPFSLRFVMDSRDLNINLDEETPRFAMAREPYIRSLYEKIEGDWGADGKDFQRFMRRLRAFGAELYTNLVPEVVREEIWKHRAVIGAIQVISHEPFIPWEALHVVEPGKPAPPNGNMFLAELGLVRWIKNTSWPPANLMLGRGRARHVIPAYVDPELQLSGAAEEKKLLQELFDSVEVPADNDSVVDLISTPGSFDLLHFACHGSASEDRIWDASLLLAGRKEGRNGPFIRDYLATTEVSQYGNLWDGQKSGPMVFLNACQAGKAGRTLIGSGGMADAFIRAGAGLFVGSLWSVGDDTARTFAQEFYQGLKSGKTVAHATRVAREATKRANEPTWLAYTVYGHPYARLTLEA